MNMAALNISQDQHQRPENSHLPVYHLTPKRTPRLLLWLLENQAPTTVLFHNYRKPITLPINYQSHWKYYSPVLSLSLSCNTILLCHILSHAMLHSFLTERVPELN